MTITLYGRTYTIKNNAMKTEMVSLLNDDNTVVLYVAQNKNKIDDYDTILLINTVKRTIFPIFLSVFNELVEPYYMPIIYSFPAFYVIESNATEFVACDYTSIAKLRNHTNNKYISYAVSDNVLMVSPDLTEIFEMFGNKKSIREPIQTSRQMFYETTINKKQANKSMPITEPVLHHQTTRVEHKSAMTEPTIKPKPSITSPVANIKPATNQSGTSRDNLFKYCDYSDDCFAILLSHNHALAIINKKYGTVKTVGFDELLENELIGYNDEPSIIREFGKIPSIMYNTNKVCLTDIRNVIRLFEQRKESPVTKQMVSYSNDTLYCALASDDALSHQTTIKNFAIESHKNAVLNYEKIKTVAKAYAKDVYCILTKTNIGIMVVSDGGKKANYLPIDDIYAAMPDVKSIGDIIRLFPIERIIDGAFFNIDSIEQVRSVMDVLPASMNLNAHKYTVKGIHFGYDKNAQIIVKSPVTTN